MAQRLQPRKRVLITGANGLLGQNLIKALGAEYEISGLDLQDRPFSEKGLSDYHRIDITRPGELKALFSRIHPDIIINTAAMTHVDRCETEREKAELVNHRAVRFLLEAAGKKTRFVQISTDYVFNGKSGPYTDEDPPDPIGFYGETKLLAETAVLSHSPGNLVVRTMVIFGRAVNARPDFITFLRDKLSKGKAVNIVTDQIGNITLASNLAENVGVLLRAGTSGVVSLAGLDIIGRHEIAFKVARHYGYDPSLVRPVKTADLKQAAGRPLNSGFRLDRARRIKGVELIDFQEQLRRYDRE
jgi:dTDP-4-dehydrorhamnose reductase